jgi:hypothetical protein
MSASAVAAIRTRPHPRESRCGDRRSPRQSAIGWHGLMHQAKGEQETACKQLEAAVAICARLGERVYDEQIEQAFAALKRE